MNRRAAALVSVVLVCGVGGAAEAAATGTARGLVVANPLQVRVTLSNSQVGVGEDVTIAAHVTNLGSGVLDSVVLALRFDPSGLALRDGPTRSIPLLSGAAEAQVSWIACARSPGRYLLLVTATADHESARTFDSESPALLLEVQPGAGTCDTAEDQIRALIEKTIAYLERLPLYAAPVAQLRTAVNALAAGRVAGACWAVERYVKLVRLGPRPLTPAQAAELTERATRILAMLRCGTKP